ncbi:MAG: hypothetical protein GC129_05345 [Proteobacteria bacterium]|nr:hypothetical protein [Pseudomonadota bacterium]
MSNDSRTIAEIFQTYTGRAPSPAETLAFLAQLATDFHDKCLAAIPVDSTMPMADKLAHLKAYFKEHDIQQAYIDTAFIMISPFPSHELIEGLAETHCKPMFQFSLDGNQLLSTALMEEEEQ